MQLCSLFPSTAAGSLTWALVRGMVTPLRQLWSVAVDCAIYQEHFKAAFKKGLYNIWHRITIPFRHLSIHF